MMSLNASLIILTWQNKVKLALMNMPYKLVYLRKTNFRFANIMESIEFRVMYFLILYPSLSRLALWIERIAVKIEMVGSSLTTCNIFFKKIFSFFIINHALDDFTRLTRKSKCNRNHFKALY